jgi:ATP-dependent Lon protease
MFGSIIMKKTSTYQLVERTFLKKEDQAPDGFEVVQTAGGGFGRSDSVKLMLPSALAADLIRPDADYAGDEEEGEGAQSTSRSADADDAAQSALPVLPRKRQTPEEKLLEELTARDAVPELPAQYIHACSSLVAIYAVGEPVKLLGQRSKSGDSTLRRRNDELIEQFKALGNQRHLLRPLHPVGFKDANDAQACRAWNAQALQAIAKAFRPLRDHHPHFRGVIDLFETTVKAAAIHGHPMKPPPVLMLGAPGIGKTYFAQDLGRVLGMPLHRIAYDSGVTNAELIGSAQYWSNTHPGKLFNALCLGVIANPIFILEEIDKAAEHGGGHGAGRNALNSLHTLLEPSSSGCVTDLSTDMSFDASHVVWLATANDARGIMPTILSRFTVFHILPPLGEDAWRVTMHLAQGVTERLGCEKLDRTILTALAVLSPREQRKALEQACAQATAAGRRALKAADLPPGLLDDELADAPSAGGKQPLWLH